MASRGMRWILASAVALALAGCDAFSLLDRLVLPDDGGSVGDPVSLTAAKTTAQRGEEIALTVAGGTSPFSFSVVAQDLYPGTAALPIGGVFNQIYTAGTAIGRIAVTVTDSSVPAASDTVYITVVPPTPTFSANRQGPTDVHLSWSYVEITVITGFLIQKSVSGGAFSDFRSYSPSLSGSDIDNSSPTNQDYKYRIYAVSGDYESIPAEMEVPAS